MRCFFSILFFFTCFIASAQSTSFILFQPGVELEFLLTGPKVGSGKPTELSRIVLKVNRVKDSSNTTYSYVTKIVRSAHMPEIGYQKDYVVRQTEGKMYFPYDLYMADTVYLADMGFKGKKGMRAYGTAKMKNPSDFVQATNLAAGKVSVEPKTFTIYGDVLKDDMNPASASFGYTVNSSWMMEITVKQMLVGAKTKVTTAAGTFECYPVTCTMEMKTMGRTFPNGSTAYCSEKYGFLKMEPGEGAAASGFELVRVKE
jgi:hypothetical protein